MPNPGGGSALIIRRADASSGEIIVGGVGGVGAGAGFLTVLALWLTPVTAPVAAVTTVAAVVGGVIGGIAGVQTVRKPDDYVPHGHDDTFCPGPILPSDKTRFLTEDEFATMQAQAAKDTVPDIKLAFPGAEQPAKEVVSA
jgi:hypothetical protein